MTASEEFAYHGLAPSFLKERHAARELLNEIYTEIKMYYIVENGGKLMVGNPWLGGKLLLRSLNFRT